MKLFNTHKPKAKLEIQDKLLAAVVSLYLYMARTARLDGEEINFIDRILHSMFGNDIPLYKIEQARQQVISLRDAANLLSVHLGVADRTKIVLNLISLAYHDRGKIHVLGSLEIVELTDLLRLDVSNLDAIYDLFENKLEVIDLPLAFHDKDKSYLRNSMLWAPVNGDFKFLGSHGKTRLLFIMIESLLLFYPETCSDNEPCRIITGSHEQRLQPKRFYRLQEDNILVVHGENGEIHLRNKDLWKIYNLGQSDREIPWQNDNTTDTKLVYRKRKFYLENKVKTKLITNKELALDELIEANQQTQLISILCQEHHSDETLLTNTDYYLCKDKQGYFLQADNATGAVLHFYLKDEQLWLDNSGASGIFLNRLPITGEMQFCLNQDIISMANTNYLINRSWELIEIPIQISELYVQEVSHRFKDGNKALNGISFRLPKGSMMAIMGPSGSGKTTLLQVLLGDIVATHSQISIDGMDFIANYAFFQKHIGYVPQDDLLFPNLTVSENLRYRLKLALPNLKNKSEISTRIENQLHSVGLFEQRNMIVGDVLNKRLSGGQRRRLNIALELILNPMIVILDEPTSGLSSKDSENIAEFLGELKEQNKIIICTIHQPNATVFRAFDQVLLLDRGGKQVYFGDSQDVFAYFDEELAQSGKRKEFLNTKRSLQMPDYFYDLIETSDGQGIRKFNPDYWEQKYRDHRFRKAMDIQTFAKNQEQVKAESKAHHKGCSNILRNLYLLTCRNFINKSRSKMNLIMTLLVAPLLAALTAFVLRGVPDDLPYTFLENQNSLLFGFISVIIFIFIGLANSIDDILGEKRSIQREIKLHVSAACQLLSKHAVLLILTALQVILYYFISAWVLRMRGFFYPQSIFLLLSGMIGYSLGLLFSSFIRDRSAIINILPLIIIPQIMFSGAVIHFADMNSSLRINHKSEIPEFCHLVPSRWLFEGWVVASAKQNLAQRQNSRFVCEARDGVLPYPAYMAKVDAYNSFLASHPESHYANEQINQVVMIAHGSYLNQDRNIFLSYRTSIMGSEYNTFYLDLLVSLLIVIVCGIITWLRLRYGFR